MVKPARSHDTMSKYENQLYLSIITAKYWKIYFKLFIILASKHVNLLGINLKGAQEFHTEHFKTLLIARRPK